MRGGEKLHDGRYARALIASLVKAAKRRGVAEISLDATEAGRPLYEAPGFRANGEGMTLVF